MFKKEMSSSVIRSLSGLVNYQGLVLGVSDEFSGLFIRDNSTDHFYDFESVEIKDLAYLDRKKIKQDHESLSICRVNGIDRMLCFPSLSKAHRNQIVFIELNRTSDGYQISHNKIQIAGLYTALGKGDREINIEGHFVESDVLVLLNRGNQASSNELIEIENAQGWLNKIADDGHDNDFSYAVKRHSVELGSFEGLAIQWTDGVYDNNGHLIFLATVEKTTNAYDDGEVLCSFIGSYDLKARQLRSIKKILDFKKAEGICKWNSNYLVCIDSDSPELCNEFYSIPIDILEK